MRSLQQRACLHVQRGGAHHSSHVRQRRPRWTWWLAWSWAWGSCWTSGQRRRWYCHRQHARWPTTTLPCELSSAHATCGTCTVTLPIVRGISSLHQTALPLCHYAGGFVTAPPGCAAGRRPHTGQCNALQHSCFTSCALSSRPHRVRCHPCCMLHVRVHVRVHLLHCRPLNSSGATTCWRL